MLVVVGTRPEAVKLAPVVTGLERADWAQPVVVTTGQHGEVVAETLRLLGVKAEHELVLERGGNTVAELQARLLQDLAGTIAATAPDLVLVQGDTASALAGAMAGFFAQVPVAHVEAGLRSGDLAAPFPEEGNRRLIGQLSALHLAPTTLAAENLRTEGVPAERIVLTGNTVVDAVRAVVDQRLSYQDARLKSIDAGDAPVVVVTAHRRESWGEPMRRIGRAVAHIAREMPAASVVVAAHMNSSVRRTLELELGNQPNVYLPGPVPYGPFVRLMARADLLITDSGGIQEEGAALGIPVVVTREVTERMEGVDAGLAVLVGSDEAKIVAESRRLLKNRDPDAAERNPYGDGRASERVVNACGWLLGHGEKGSDFRPGGRA
ncbi:MAG TPA: UDP-N-acetylglucosamine 2-epimerase (non-hydrolyzing) [Mycobacteriales bacterium]|nr:UDP-N-acetylglucosamine 2-epimerase (non-hydrolyzing) [Mycobacteriales bacterium]